MPQARRSLRLEAVRLRALGIVAVGLLVYINSLSAPFLFDDQNSIVDNPQIRQLWPLTVPLSPPRDTPVAGRPIVNLTYALNYALGGLRVEGYHLVNVGIHVLAALLLFGIVRRTLLLPNTPEWLAASSTNLAWAVALIWMLHPLQTEAVDYLSERTESLMGLFYLATIYSAIRALDHRGVRHWSTWQTATVAACAFGMACKESMVTAPLVVLLYDRIFVFPSIKEMFRVRRALYAGLASTWLVLAALMLTVPRSSVGFSTATTPWLYFMNQLRLVVRYLHLSVWPRMLVLDYGLPQPLRPTDVIGPAILLAVLALATLVALVRWPRIGFLAACVFVTLAPTSSFVPIATEVGAERRMYLPLAALAALAVTAWYALTTRGVGRSLANRRPRLNVAMLTIVSILLATATFARNREYRSRLEMAQTIVDRWPNGRAHFILGSELIGAGRHDEAMAEFRASARDYPGARYALGTELVAAGDLDKGIAELEAFIRAQPSHPNVTPAREMIGRALLAQKRLEPAAEQFALVLQIAPGNPDAHALLGDVRLNQGRYMEAVQHYEQALRVRPGASDVLDNLGIALASSGRLDEAIDAFQRAIAANPGDPVAPNLLGRALASRGQLTQALVQFRRALELDPSYGDARANLAAAEAELRVRPR